MSDLFEQHPASNVYFDKYFGLEAAKILPGEYYGANREMVLVTVLGSCVSACIWDPSVGVGGMNHFMLPDNSSTAPAAVGVVSLPARYGAYAMEVLINHLVKLGARKSALRAKIFGGANVMKGFQNFDVGGRNCAFVQVYLEEEGIPVVASDLMDIYPRKVYFFPSTGKVLIKKLRTAHNDTVFRREIEYGSKLRQTEVSGDVELF